MANAIAIIHEENGVYGISFPDFPGCVSTGESMEDVLTKGSQILTFHVAGMAEDGDNLPFLRTIAEVRTDPDFTDDDGGVFAIVPFEYPGETVPVSIAIDEELLRAIDEAAKAAGQSRSAFLASTVRAKIGA